MKLQYFKKIIIFVTLSVSLYGCTNTVKQASDFSDAGLRYSATIEILLGATKDAVIESDSRDLLYIQSLKSKDKKAELKKILDKHDNNIKKTLSLLNGLHKDTRTLKLYFTNLKALASYDASTSFSNSVASLSGSINEANKKIRASGNVLISPSAVKAISALAGLVAKGYQSSLVNSALKRDAGIIGEQLLLHEKLMDKLAGMLKRRGEEVAVLKKKNLVVKPYKNKSIRNETAWKKARKEVLVSSFQSSVLSKAKDSAKQMRSIWKNILENKTDAAVIGILIDDLNEIIGVAELIKASMKEGEA